MRTNVENVTVVAERVAVSVWKVVREVHALKAMVEIGWDVDILKLSHESFALTLIHLVSISM